MAEIVDSLLTPQQVADHFKVSTRTVRRWCDDGRLEWCYVGSRMRRIRADSLKRIPDWQ